MAETVNLAKGQKVDLTKGNPGLVKIAVGMGWDVNKGNGSAFDLDAFCICLDESNKAVTGGTLYYGSPRLNPADPTDKRTVILNESLLHTGDNLTGVGDGDDEIIILNLVNIPANVSKIICAANIYEAGTRGQNFGQVRNAYLRVYNPDGNTELLKYDLGEDYSTFQGVVFGEVYRNNGEWKFGAVSNGFNGTINDVLGMY